MLETLIWGLRERRRNRKEGEKEWRRAEKRVRKERKEGRGIEMMRKRGYEDWGQRGEGRIREIM